MRFLPASIHSIQANTRDSRCFLHQVARELAAFAGHYLTSGQGKTQRIRLIFKIKNDLSRHMYFSPWLISL